MPSAILIVDDEPVVRSLLKHALADGGLTALLADSGESALEIYGREAASIDLVLMDIRMPGLDGVQTLKALKSINPAIRCCLMSGETAGYTWSQLNAAGALDVLSKPFANLRGVIAYLKSLIPVAA